MDIKLIKCHISRPGNFNDVISRKPNNRISSCVLLTCNCVLNPQLSTFAVHQISKIIMIKMQHITCCLLVQ